MCPAEAHGRAARIWPEMLDAFAEACEQVTGRRLAIASSARLADDLELSSLHRYEVLIALEERWDVELVDDGDVAGAQTVGELLGLIACVLAGPPRALVEDAAGGHGAPGPVVLEGRSLGKIYGKGEARTVALAECDVTLRRGEILTIVGPSGSGKSTLLHLLSGLEDPTSGSVHFEQADLRALSDGASASLRARRMGFVLQRANLVPSLTVRENVAAPLMLAGVRRAGALAAADLMLERVGLSHRRAAFPGQVSGGEAQRAAVARACVGEPAAIFADEPTGAVDRAAGEVVMGLFEGLVRECGAGVVIVTHDMALAARGDRTLMLIDGRPAS
jgi:lipoprotein-releasing system ATP-binding protein